MGGANEAARVLIRGLSGYGVDGSKGWLSLASKSEKRLEELLLR